MMSRGLLRPDQVAAIIEAYKNGTSSVSLAEQFGVTSTAIRRWLRLNNVEMRAAAKPRLASYEALCADYQIGMTQQQVADKHRVSVPTVCRVLKQHGIAIHQRVSGPAHPDWKGGGRYISHDRYVIVGGEREHRTIMEQLLERPLSLLGGCASHRR